MKLSDEAYNGLNKIATATKMDCWFWIKTNKKGDILVDLENNEELDWASGLAQFAEGIIFPLSSMKLSPEEIEAIKYLFEFYGIHIDKTLLN